MIAADICKFYDTNWDSLKHKKYWQFWNGGQENWRESGNGVNDNTAVEQS